MLSVMWHLWSLWMLVYADPQLMSNLWAVSVTVIRLSSWTRALSLSKRPPFAKCRDFTNVCSAILETIHPLIHFYLLNTLLLWIPEGFTLFGHKNRMIARCSAVVQSKSVASTFTVWLYELYSPHTRRKSPLGMRYTRMRKISRRVTSWY
jgi:hypothetical protein